jgi:hypothetical protein
MWLRVGWLILGSVITMVVLAVGAYLFVTAGGISMDTTAPPLPLEQTVARLALHASVGHAAGRDHRRATARLLSRSGIVACFGRD